MDGWVGSGMDSGARVRWLRALAEVGLGARPDSGMEWVAHRVCELLRVPIAVVSFALADRQVFPGLCGPPAPWSSRREAPLRHSLCERVVAAGEPVVVEDRAIDEFGGAAYAGMPLTAEDGTVLGALCVIDTEPRAWTPAELAVLRDMARMCVTELRLRLARHDAEVERARSDDLQSRLSQALLRAQLLLTASQALSDVASVTGLRDQIADLVIGDLKATRVALVITQDLGERTRLEDQRETGPEARHDVPRGQWDEFDVAASSLVARAVRDRRLVHIADLRIDLDGAVEPDDQAAYLARGAAAVMCVPVLDSSGVLGVLELTWDEPHEHDPMEHAVVATIAGYVGAALQRARFLQHRISVARDLQEAMLTDLPDLPGLRLAARYLPADADEQVGGDWYDAFPLTGQDGVVAVVVGDVMGHDIEAAAHMGQLRAMLRQACWQERNTPAGAVTALDHAVTGLEEGASGTAVVAYLVPAEDGGRELVWTNAGHPPPILVDPDGSTRILRQHDHLIGFTDSFRGTRRDARTTLVPGATLLLYTDGLVERQSGTMDEEIANLAASAAAAKTTDPGHLIDVVLRRTADRYRFDDVVLLAVHIPAHPEP
ncbi:SpoIIE family protein phosphatase [Actinophytocola algeriensis]|uniref:Serine phosphatase RsbU (Regulator of sigma subunit) n=1 Tax=Actinophytocola algeriensis TaxID=1768010 RepID=A0A7W7VFN0_9PSEU|nr:SpoIIE family protein phosphatase [Actinophytocola algeriensis]MBB4908532.1 serine phosphatase RsbU (regulator of sigma subunit) [Actinophytocola algeriensis]MBE1475081.1 serine phosphatase RsbU (regulator of sigma subunit) [Actinophytocola algeriensis]